MNVWITNTRSEHEHWRLTYYLVRVRWGPEPRFWVRCHRRRLGADHPCRCALGLATPISTTTTGRGAQVGVLVKREDVLGRMAHSDTLVTD